MKSGSCFVMCVSLARTRKVCQVLRAYIGCQEITATEKISISETMTSTISMNLQEAIFMGSGLVD